MNQRLELILLPDATCVHAATHNWTKAETHTHTHTRMHADTLAPDELSINRSVTAAAELINSEAKMGGNGIIMVKQSVCISGSHDLHSARAHPTRALPGHSNLTQSVY